ncbi:MAG: hypothetical protein IJ083_14695 [Clostridia bacterium]|nr:hypothetical protein [Clostridia bacterium]
MDRILLLLASNSFSDVSATLRDAMEKAKDRENISIGLSLGEEPGEEEAQEMAGYGELTYLCPGSDSWHDARRFWRGEALIMVSQAGMGFTKGWDAQMQRTLRSLGPHAALTGMPPYIWHVMNTMWAVGASKVEDGYLTLHRGAAMHLTTAPQRTPFLNPGFCFAPAAFFRLVAEDQEVPFLMAFAQGWKLYTLHLPLLSMSMHIQLPEVRLPDDGVTEAFLAEYGFQRKKREIRPSAAAILGLARQNLIIERKMPLNRIVRQRLLYTGERSGKRMPLCVTCFLTLPVSDGRLGVQQFYFRQLCEAKNLPLMCFAEKEMLMRVQNVLPNTLEFRRSYGIRAEGQLDGERVFHWLSLSLVHFLESARSTYTAYTHYIWLDPDVLRCPVWEGVNFQWQGVCTNQIVLARVREELDLSMIAVPTELLAKLARAVEALVEDSVRRDGVWPDVHEMWKKLIWEHPTWFRVLELPARREMIYLAMAGHHGV